MARTEPHPIPTLDETGVPPQEVRLEEPPSAEEQESPSDSDGPISQQLDDIGIRHLLLGLSVWLGIALVIAWNTDSGEDFLRRWWWAIGGAVGVLVLALLLESVRERLRKATGNTRDALLSFVVAPLLLLILGTVVVMPARYQVPALRWIFLFIVVLLPASMWYLFIATRKTSVLNDFVGNLNRLGLLTRDHSIDNPEAEAMFQRCVYTYIQKFEAIYGSVPDNVARDIVCGRFVLGSSQEKAVGLVRSSPATAPIMLSTALIALGWITAMPPWLRSPDIGVPDVPLAEQWLVALAPAETPVNFAFLGAYFFSLQMLFRRYIRRDLRGSAYVAITMRIILALIGIWVVSVVAQEMSAPATTAQLLMLGFVIGVFPRVAWQMVQTAFKKITGVVLSNFKTDLPVSDLDGLTVWHEARLEEEDIENVPNMASADIVELMLNTRLPADRIIDWVDQAILYTYIGAKRKDTRSALRAHGIRTATSFLRVHSSEGGPREIPFGDGKFLDAKSVAIGLETSPQLRLIRNWRRLS